MWHPNTFLPDGQDAENTCVPDAVAISKPWDQHLYDFCKNTLSNFWQLYYYVPTSYQSWLEMIDKLGM